MNNGLSDSFQNPSFVPFSHVEEGRDSSFAGKPEKGAEASIAKEALKGFSEEAQAKSLEGRVSGKGEADLKGITPLKGIEESLELTSVRPKNKDPLKWTDADIHPKFKRESFEKILTKLNQKGGYLSSEEAAWIVEVSFGNKDFNTFINANKRKETPLYELNEKFMNAVSHFSYITQKAGDLATITSRASHLIDKHKNNEPIDEAEKLKPQEVHLIDSYFRSTLYASSFIKNTLLSMPDGHPAKRGLLEIKGSLTFWSEIKDEAMKTYKNGDIMFDTKNLAEYSNHGGKFHDGNKLHTQIQMATGAECFHAALFYNDFDEALKQGVPMQSHVVGELCKTPLNIGQLSYVEVFRVDVLKLLREEVFTLPGIEKGDLTSLFENNSQAVSAELHERFQEDNPIQNGNLPMLSLFLGQNLNEKAQSSMKELPVRSMVCSEYAAYATLISLNKFENNFRMFLEQQRKSQTTIDDYLTKLGTNSLLKPLFPVDSPLVLHPANLYKMLMKQGAVARVEPDEKVAAFMQTPKSENVSDLALDKETYIKGEFAHALHWRSLLNQIKDFIESLPTG